MLDKNRIKDKINIIENNLRYLKKFLNYSTEEFVNDYKNPAAAKYLLQTSIEAMIDIANHIIASKRLKKPETSAQSFKILNNNDYISDEKLSNYIKMIKFRNRLVHLYNEIDDEQIYHIIKNNLSDLEYFIKEIIKIL